MQALFVGTESVRRYKTSYAGLHIVSFCDRRAVLSVSV